MSLYDILACPTCKVSVSRGESSLECPTCGTVFPVVNGVPIMFPDGSNPEIEHEDELNVYDTYNPWVHRIILQSLLDDQVVVDIGSGNMALDDPCIIRMDVKLGPHVDLVGDAHALPFLPESLDYVFSLAVVEHLRNPFLAAQEMYHALKDGGYIYHECNFVFAYHGYPHHYFNATLQGMEQIFQCFTPLRTGVAPYQMPSFALNMVLSSYLYHSRGARYRHGRRLHNLLYRVLQQDLMEHDIYFSEEAALNVAAGTYYSGFKRATPSSSLIPAPIWNAWESDALLKKRIPEVNDLTVVDNILRWAKEEGRFTDPDIARFLDGVAPFSKWDDNQMWNRDHVHGLDYAPAPFGPIGSLGYSPEGSLDEHSQIAESKYQQRHAAPLGRRVSESLHNHGRKAALREVLYYLLERLED